MGVGFTKNSFAPGVSLFFLHFSNTELYLLVLLLFHLFLGAAAVTILFYFLLSYLNTANLIFSTISVFTSFFAAMLLICRSPYYALGYVANDVVLIVLWVLASIESLSYLPMVFCFLTFFVNDGYGFISWKRRQKRQAEAIE